MRISVWSSDVCSSDLVPIALMRRTTRQEISFAVVLDGVISGIRNSLQVVAATACAGIVIGVISLTGVGVEFSAFVIGLAQNNLILRLEEQREGKECGRTL